MGSSHKYPFSICFVLTLLSLWPAASAVDVDCTAREGVDSRYSRGLLFIDSYDVGVKHCYLTGTVHRPENDTKQELTTHSTDAVATTPSRLSIFLTARQQADDTVIVSA